MVDVDVVVVVVAVVYAILLNDRRRRRRNCRYFETQLICITQNMIVFYLILFFAQNFLVHSHTVCACVSCSFARSFVFCFFFVFSC